MADVFISYSRQDQAFVRRLHDSLAARGREAWVDWEDIPASARWRDDLRRAIESADAFVFVLSPASASSRVCREELDHAVGLNKRLVPLVLSEPGGEDVPPSLAEVNWLFVGDDFEAALDALVSTLDTDLDWVRSHTRLLVRALEWEARGDKSLLLRGRDLEGAEQAVQEHAGRPPAPTPLQLQYLLTSRRAATRRQRGTVVTALTGAIAMLALTIVAVFQRNEAKSQRDLALSRQLAASARAQILIDPELGLLLAKEAFQSDIRATAELDAALRQATAASPVRASLSGHVEDGSVAFSPDGQRVVIGGADKELRLWTWGKRGPPVGLGRHDGAVTDVAFSPGTGRYVASGGLDKKVRVWDSTGGTNPVDLQQDAAVSAVAFGPDERYVASGGSDGKVHVWDWAARSKVDLGGHERAANDVVFSPDGRYVASAGNDQTVRVYDWRTGGTPVAQKNYGTRVFAVAFSPDGDGRHLAIASEDKTVRLWQWRGGDEPLVLSGHRNAVSAVAFSRDGRYVASAGLDKTVRVWEWAGRGAPVVLRGHRGAVSAVAFSVDGHLASAGDDDAVRVWEWAAREPVVLRGHAAAVNDVAFSPDGRYVASAGDDKTVRVWEWATRSQPVILNGHEAAVNDVAFSPGDGRYLASAGADGSARVWEWAGGRPVAVRQVHHVVYAVAFSPDGRHLAGAGGNGDVWVWRWAARGGPSVVESHDDAVSDVAFSPDGRYLASAALDRTVRVGESAERRHRWVLPGHKDAVRSIAFDRTGELLSSAGADSSVRVWKRTGEGRVVLLGHDDGVRSVAFLSEGLMVSGGDDHSVRLWNWRSGGFPTSLGLYDTDILGVASLGRLVASAGRDGTVRVMECEVCGPIGEVQDLAKSRVTRELTREERKAFAVPTHR
jgi:WD40 repeat protein